ncbi:mucin-1 [Hemiscyllium ocellatum]|uniref:mucin-1 n=1 Tax=Hemiscyllium ocellatum TaxID=170820 RepID=UPI00296624EE|nr:mucin-1 [Hemiscyllium ocellatum]
MEAAREEQGGCALLNAISKGQVHLARFLLEAVDGSLLETRDQEARTPLMYSVLLPAPAARARFMRLLLERGARVDSSERTGRTALSLACELGLVDAVKLLVQSSADPELADHRGNTPLMYAAASGHRDVVIFLLRAFKRLGLDIERPNRAGLSAGQVARLLGHRDCALALEAAARTGRERGHLPPDQPAGHSIGQSLGHSTAQSLGQSPGHSLGHYLDHSTGQSPGHSSGQSLGQSPGHSHSHSPGDSLGHSPGHYLGHSPDHYLGHSTGHSSGHSGHFPGHSVVHSSGHPLGDSLDHLLAYSGDSISQSLGPSSGHSLSQSPGHSRTPFPLGMDEAAPFSSGPDAMVSIDEEGGQDEDEDPARERLLSQCSRPRLCSLGLQDGSDPCTSLLPPLSSFSEICTLRTTTPYSPRPAKNEATTQRQWESVWTKIIPGGSASTERGSGPSQRRDSWRLASYFQKRCSLPTSTLCPCPPAFSKGKDVPSTRFGTFTTLGSRLLRHFTVPSFTQSSGRRGSTTWETALRMPRSETFPIGKDHPQISNMPSIDSVSGVQCEFPILNQSS